MTTNPPTFSKRALDALTANSNPHQWEQLIGNLLRKLDLPDDVRAQAEQDYLHLANAIASRLNILRTDIDVFPQGSMRTQTTIPQRHPAKFDLDIVVRLKAPWLAHMDPHELFKAFGRALQGNESVTGVPEEKRRCWSLPYPGKKYYFDVTPAVSDPNARTGEALRVRDPDTHWSPSNPVEFANWFCKRAALRFKFQQHIINKAAMDRANITPLPDEQVGLDDILRRVVQLMKLHRDGLYWYANQEVKRVQPISVILVTLAGHAIEKLWAEEQTGVRSFTSAIEVALAVVERLPILLQPTNGQYVLPNPMLPAENFADKWNGDGGARAKQFELWHKKLETDLEALLHQGQANATEEEIRGVFGQVGVDAWKASKPSVGIMEGLLGSVSGYTKTNPTTPTRPGSSGTLG